VIFTVLFINSVTVLEESPHHRGSSSTNFQVFILVLEFNVLVLELQRSRNLATTLHTFCSKYSGR